MVDQEAEKQELSKLDHVAICVHDLNAALAWYSSSFDCELVYRDDEQAILQFDNIRVALVMPSFQRPHLAFLKSDADTYGEIRDLVDGTESTFISDASGNLTELVVDKG